MFQIRKAGFDPGQVKDCVLTHLDFDHAGGLSDFPDARVHVSAEEYGSLAAGSGRYLASQFAHRPHFVVHGESDMSWFGLPARRIDVGIDINILMVPLFGHTRGHCGIAVEHQGRWLFYAGDAFYQVDELDAFDHPVTVLSEAAAEDNVLRLESFEKVRSLGSNPALEIYCYHDGSGLDKFNRVKTIL